MNSVPESGTFGRVPDVEREVAAAGEVTPSVAFRVLANEQRRFLLYLLVEHDGSAPADELVARLAGTDVDATADSGLPGRVHRRMYHNHLPRLAEHGVVEYDRDADTVSLTEVGEALEPYLEFAKGREQVDVEAFLDGN